MIELKNIDLSKVTEIRQYEKVNEELNELKEALSKEPFFDCAGGCDLSNGESQCMSSSGIWFKYCPFCSKKIISRRTEKGTWEWFEE